MATCECEARKLRELREISKLYPNVVTLHTAFISPLYQTRSVRGKLDEEKRIYPSQAHETEICLHSRPGTSTGTNVPSTVSSFWKRDTSDTVWLVRHSTVLQCHSPFPQRPSMMLMPITKRWRPMSRHRIC